MIRITYRETSSGLNYIALLAMGFASELFPHDCWASSVWSETCLVLSGHGKYTKQALRRWQNSEDIGPCGCLTIAFLLKQGKRHKQAQVFASRGVKQLSVQDFQNDYQSLLDESYLLGKCLTRCCKILCALQEHELKELQAQIPEQWASVFALFSRELRREPDRPLEDSMAAALDIAWESGLSSWIEGHLLKFNRELN